MIRIMLQLDSANGPTVVEVEGETAAGAVEEADHIAQHLPAVLDKLGIPHSASRMTATEAKQKIAKAGPSAETAQTVRLGDEKVNRDPVPDSQGASSTACDDQHKPDPNTEEQHELPLDADDKGDSEVSHEPDNPSDENDSCADSEEESGEDAAQVTLAELRKLITGSTKEGKATAKAFIVDKVGKPDITKLDEADYPALKAAVEEAQS